MLKVHILATNSHCNGDAYQPTQVGFTIIEGSSLLDCKRLIEWIEFLWKQLFPYWNSQCGFYYPPSRYIAVIIDHGYNLALKRSSRGFGAKIAPRK